MRSGTVEWAAALVGVAAAALVAQAQPGGGRGQPGGQPEGTPGGPGGGPGNVDAFVSRLLRNDANGDGKLQWEEVPEQNRERLFERGDANKDKVLDQDELRAMAATSPRRIGPGGPGGTDGATATLHDSMEQAGRAMRTIRRSQFSDMSRRQDLSAMQSLQSALVAAKGQIQEAKMSEPAKAKFKDDTAAFHKEFRQSMIRSTIKAMELELAIVNGDAAAATKHRDELLALQKEAHELFQPDAEEEDAGGAPPRREPGAGRPGPGGGRPGGGGGGGGRPPE